MRRVAITVDVEAHPFRAEKAHLDRLIWGRQAGLENGIGAMMDMADRHGAALTFFVDYPEDEIYGGAMADTAREIRRRGHDPQPHCHLEYLNKKLFGIEEAMALRLPDLSAEQAKRVAGYLVEAHDHALGAAPLAYRSRGYELGPALVCALGDAGFVVDASYSVAGRYAPLPLGVRSCFRFSNGLMEVPVPCIPYFQSRWPLVPWNFNHRVFLEGDPAQCLQRHKAFLDQWFARHGDDKVATLVMHCWSFWQMDPRGFFSIPNERAPELFESLLAMLAKEFEIVSLGELAAQERQAPQALETVAVDARETLCPVCSEPASHFQDDEEIRGRRCPFCGSLEQQRTLVDLLYAGAFGRVFFHNKDILHLAPHRAETLLLRRMAGARVTTLESLAMLPGVEDASFDIILGSPLFPHESHPEQAFQEMARILRPGGIWLYGAKPAVDDATDSDEVVTEQALAPWFLTRAFAVDDGATGAPTRWLACVPKTTARSPAPTAGQPALHPAILSSNAGRILFDARQDPVETLLPGFEGWPAFRAGASRPDLTWLKEIIFDLLFDRGTPMGEELPQPAEFPANYPAGVHPYPVQSFRYLRSCLPPDPASGDSPQLRLVVSELERWIDAYGFYADAVHMDTHTRWMVWHDTAAAIRLNFFSYALLRILPQPRYGDALCEKLFRAAMDHFLLLCAEHFFIKDYNHGFLQLIGLLAFAAAWPAMRGASSVTPLITGRLEALLAHTVSPEGFPREHTPIYHANILAMLTAIARFLDGAPAARLRDHIAQVRERLPHFITPGGLLMPLGDTPPYIKPRIADEVRRARDRCKDLPPLAVFPLSGYAFLRLRQPDAPPKAASCLTLTGAFHSLVHKHCDDLGFVWSEGAQNLLVDPGQQYGYEGMLSSGPLWEKGFYYSTPNRVYSESAHAHNCVEINGQCYSRRVAPYGALPLAGGQLSPTCWFLQGEWQRPEGFRQWRRLVLSPGRWLLVMDEVQPMPERAPKAPLFSQWFHFDASLELRSRSDAGACLYLPGGRPLWCQNLAGGEITLHRGEFAPRLQGWQATTSPGSLEPAWALGIHVTAPSATFCTLFSLLGPCEEMNKREGVFQLRFSNGTTEKFPF